MQLIVEIIRTSKFSHGFVCVWLPNCSFRHRELCLALERNQDDILNWIMEFMVLYQVFYLALEKNSRYSFIFEP